MLFRARWGRLVCHRTRSGTLSDLPPAASWPFRPPSRFMSPSVCGDPADPNVVVPGHDSARDLNDSPRPLLTRAQGSCKDLRIAAWESEKTVRLLPDCPLASIVLIAWYMAKGSASKASLLLPRKKRLPVQLSAVCQGHAAPTLPSSSRDRCWWYGGGKQQTRHHLFTECRA